MKQSNQPKHISKAIAEWLVENPQLSTAPMVRNIKSLKQYQNKAA